MKKLNSYSIFISLAVTLLSNQVYAQENSISMVADKYSKAYGVSKNEATRRLDLMAKYSLIESQLKSEFGENIAGVFYDSSPNELKLVVRTTKKGKSYKDIKKVTESMSIPIEVIPNSPRSKQSIENIIENQGARLTKQYSNIQTIGYNPRLDAISLFIYEPDTSKQNELKKIPALQKISGMDTEFVFLESSLESLALYGGAPITQNNDTLALSYRNPCTAGFPAIRNGRAGLVTAAHCVPRELTNNGKFQYKGYDGTVVNMTMTAYDPNARTHDMAFIQPDDPNVQVSNQYYTDPQGNKQDMSASFDVVVGDFICHQGQTTGFSCGEVSQVNIINQTRENRGCPSNLQGISCLNTFVAARSVPSGGYFPIDPLRVDQGDSGGPVFGGVPYGIVSSGAGNVMIFSQLKYLSSLGVQLKLN